MPTTINRKLYPELDKLLWDVHCETVDPEFAFRVYEERWGFVQFAPCSPSNFKPRL